MENDEERYVDPVIEAYKKDIDRTLIGENLKRAVEERSAPRWNFSDSLKNCGARDARLDYANRASV